MLACASTTLVLIFVYSNRRSRGVLNSITQQHVIKESGGVYRFPKGRPPSVNLVVAATSMEDYSWVDKLRVPELVVVPYIADNTSASHHPQKNKGHEAMIYHQYFYDFYDNLPDVSVLIHSHQQSWHIEQLLEQDMVFSLSHLDLREVQRRQFLNLRVTWGIGCSSGSINTTRVNEESGAIPEEKEMQEAFRANFNIYEVPEILATPCCSQIAVTRERVRAIPREQYQHHINWLLNTDLPDNISGRTWEHMWQYLFLQKAIDCPLEHKAYCRLYHICFGGREQYDEWIELEQGRRNLEGELRKLDQKELMQKNHQEGDAEENGQEPLNDGREAAKAKARTRKWLESELTTIKEAIRVMREVAVVRGAVEANRMTEGEELYGDDVEPGIEKIILPQSSLP
ncbi:hypothetical protein N431DRAFT_416757 [Stipitochalara longipes BDJ]|nr:hypothetical protein N431DRAFT_416757 [Stipitochalara longipes BDJ]